MCRRLAKDWWFPCLPASRLSLLPGASLGLSFPIWEMGLPSEPSLMGPLFIAGSEGRQRQPREHGEWMGWGPGYRDVSTAQPGLLTLSSRFSLHLGIARSEGEWAGVCGPLGGGVGLGRHSGFLGPSHPICTHRCQGHHCPWVLGRLQEPRVGKDGSHLTRASLFSSSSRVLPAPEGDQAHR